MNEMETQNVEIFIMTTLWTNETAGEHRAIGDTLLSRSMLKPFFYLLLLGICTRYLPTVISPSLYESSMSFTDARIGGFVRNSKYCVTFHCYYHSKSESIIEFPKQNITCGQSTHTHTPNHSCGAMWFGGK